jgi:hypothetical protein
MWQGCDPVESTGHQENEEKKEEDKEEEDEEVMVVAEEDEDWDVRQARPWQQCNDDEDVACFAIGGRGAKCGAATV